MWAPEISESKGEGGEARLHGRVGPRGGWASGGGVSGPRAGGKRAGRGEGHWASAWFQGHLPFIYFFFSFLFYFPKLSPKRILNAIKF